MIERICPKCKVPMNGTYCIKPKCGHATEMASTLYWCNDCNIPIYEKECPICGKAGSYLSTDLRPVFPEENILISLILTNDPFKYQKSSVWYGSNAYIIDGRKEKLSVSKENSKPIEEIKSVKEAYEDASKNLDYKYFDEYIERFVRANADRYNFITEEAISFIQKYT